MYSINKVKSVKDGPYTSPVKAKVIATSPTKTYMKNGEKKSWTDFSLADHTGVIKGVCYDPTKLGTIKEENSVMIRNFIKRENLLIVTSSTKASITSAVPDIPSEKVEEAKQLIAPPPVAEEKSIAEAKKMPVNSLVTVTGKIVRIDDVQARTLRNQETVNVRSVIIKDSTGEVTVSLWRELTETTLEIGQSYRVTDLKLNFYHGVQLNTLTRSTVVKVETPAEEVTVMVDGFFMEKDKVILVCKMSSEDFVDYTCPITVLKAFTNNVEEPVNVMAEMIPFDAKLTLSGNDTIDSINKL